MRLSENQVRLDDYMLYGRTIKTSYIESKIDYSSIMEISDGDGTMNAYISIYMLMDDEHKVTDR